MSRQSVLTRRRFYRNRAIDAERAGDVFHGYDSERAAFLGGRHPIYDLPHRVDFVRAQHEQEGPGPRQDRRVE
jgi:hypothetical protein